MMEEIKNQLNGFLEGDELLKELTVLPPYIDGLTSVSDRLEALMDIYKIFIPNRSTVDIYNRLYIAVLGSLNKKDTIEETRLFNENFRVIKGGKRYGVIGGFDSFRITGNAGLGKTASIERCADLISNRKVLINQKPYREIIPILIVECVADGSFKNLLFSILQKVDSLLGTTYFSANNHVTMTVDSLLSATSNVLINHCCLLVIDEIERVANESRKGETLINYLTQLVNQSNISICFVGNESSNRYFETKEYMSRRTIGMSIRRMDYSDDFCRFVDILFRYQYTKYQVSCSSEYTRLIYELTNGIPSMIVSLFVESQRNAIIYGEEVISKEIIIDTFNNYFANMKSYINPQRASTSKRIETSDRIDGPSLKTTLFQEAHKLFKGDMNRMIEYLNSRISVEYIKL